MRKYRPISFRPANPKIRNIFLDSCAFDPKYSPEDKASLEIFKRYEDGDLVVIIAHSNQKEVDHPNTPDWVKKQVGSLIYTLKTSLTEIEKAQKNNILDILVGNGKPENMTKDADHIFEGFKIWRLFRDHR